MAPIAGMVHDFDDDTTGFLLFYTYLNQSTTHRVGIYVYLRTCHEVSNM